MDKIDFKNDVHLSLDWEKGLLILCLDCVTRYWAEFGFKFDAEVQRLIREYIESEEALDELSEEEYHFSMESDLVNTLLEKIVHARGETAAKELQLWIENRFIIADKLRWNWEWGKLICCLGDGSEAPVVTGIGLDKLARLDQIAEKWVTIEGQLEDEIDRLEQEPKSKWDEARYAEYRKENPDISPLDWLEGYLCCWRFIDIWEEILSLLTPDELNALELWAKAFSFAKKRNPEKAIIPDDYRHRK